MTQATPNENALAVTIDFGDGSWEGRLCWYEEMFRKINFKHIDDNMFLKRYSHYISHSGKWELEFELIEINPTRAFVSMESYKTNSDEALEEMQKRGLEPAGLDELLVFQANFPNHKGRRVASLGGFPNLTCGYPYLSADFNALWTIGYRMDYNFRFLAVKSRRQIV